MNWDSWEFRNPDPNSYPVPASAVAIELLGRIAWIALRRLRRRARAAARSWVGAIDSWRATRRLRSRIP